jgi:hypothetical protein
MGKSGATETLNVSQKKTKQDIVKRILTWNTQFVKSAFLKKNLILVLQMKLNKYSIHRKQSI